MKQIPRLLAVAVLVACSDSLQPTTENVVGDYSLQTLTTTTDTAGTTDWVAAGATFAITIAANGTTAGHLFVPGAEGGGDFNADMAGTWTLRGDTIFFTQTAFSFVREMPFLAGENRITGDHTFGVTRVRVALTK